VAVGGRLSQLAYSVELPKLLAAEALQQRTGDSNAFAGSRQFGGSEEVLPGPTSVKFTIGRQFIWLLFEVGRNSYLLSGGATDLVYLREPELLKPAIRPISSFD